MTFKEVRDELWTALGKAMSGGNRSKTLVAATLAPLLLLFVVASAIVFTELHESKCHVSEDSMDHDENAYDFFAISYVAVFFILVFFLVSSSGKSVVETELSSKKIAMGLTCLYVGGSYYSALVTKCVAADHITDATKLESTMIDTAAEWQTWLVFVMALCGGLLAVNRVTEDAQKSPGDKLYTLAVVAHVLFLVGGLWLMIDGFNVGNDLKWSGTVKDSSATDIVISLLEEHCTEDSEWMPHGGDSSAMLGAGTSGDNLNIAGTLVFAFTFIGTACYVAMEKRPDMDTDMKERVNYVYAICQFLALVFAAIYLSAFNYTLMNPVCTYGRHEFINSYGRNMGLFFLAVGFFTHIAAIASHSFGTGSSETIAASLIGYA